MEIIIRGNNAEIAELVQKIQAQLDRNVCEKNRLSPRTVTRHGVEINGVHYYSENLLIRCVGKKVLCGVLSFGAVAVIDGHWERLIRE